MTNLEEQIKLLVELQGLDTQILRLENELNSTPEKIKAIEDAYKEKTANLKKLEDGVRSLQVKRKEKEMELETKEGSIKKFQTQMYQVKTNKEYSALQEEIERAKADNSVIEEDIIKILDQVDARNKDIVREKDFLKKQEAESVEQKKKLNDDAAKIRSQLDNLQAQRTALAGKVEKTILSKYERIVKSKDGLAVVPVANESCQGCFRILPPQVINEIRMKAQLVFCENCARILYIEE